MTRPLIALVTDFGLQDHYVGVMKGVMLGVCPDAQLVDISHGIPPQDIVGAALELEAAYRYFPPGTVFLVVVDPGVGSARRALAIDTGAYRFVGPDNGVLALVATATSGRRVVELINPQYARPTISLTFEGRDRFAPAAAWLASGVDVSAFGPEVSAIVALAWPVAREVSGCLEGTVVWVDRFGTLVTNIDRALIEALPAPADVFADLCHVGALVTTYADAPPGGVCALLGSANRLEIAVRGGSAASTLGLGTGAPVRVRPRA